MGRVGTQKLLTVTLVRSLDNAMRPVTAMSRNADDGGLRLAVDIGGTFTDLVAIDPAGRLRLGKALSTHGALTDGITASADVANLSFRDVVLFLHGSTIAINTLLERTGAETVLLTTRGFRDIYEIGRINRPDAYNLFFQKHEPLVKRSSRLEVDERIGADGRIVEPLDEAALRATARALRSRTVAAVAVMFLHSYRNPEHERRARAILEEELPDAFVSISHELTREHREFERTSTVVANAYIGPRVRDYLGDMQQRLVEQGFAGQIYVVQSTGGLYPLEDARRECVRMLESGPAAGVVSAQALCRQLALPDAIAFDMGGTTAKAGLIRAYQPLTSSHALIGSYGRGLPIQIPMIDIVEVGTGGGSIARVGAGGALRVGPQSAGSMPGPACYGRGEEPTVTDANLILGRLDPDHFLGGTMRLEPDRAEMALRDRIAVPLGLDAVGAALGIVKIAVSAMSYAVKGVTTERGLDVSQFAMIVYGGAGPLHGAAIARELGISRIIIPFAPGHFSAYGMLFGDIRYDYVRSCFRRLDDEAMTELAGYLEEMSAAGRRTIATSTVSCETVRVTAQADMRHVGQEHAITVDIDVDDLILGQRQQIRAAFDAEHITRYGVSAPSEPVEVVSLRVAVHGVVPKPAATPLIPAREPLERRALDRRKPVHFGGDGYVETPVFRRDHLSPGDHVTGPALIEEQASTTPVFPGDELRVDDFGNLLISIGGR